MWREYQVETKQQRAERGNEENVDKVGREVAEPSARVHDVCLRVSSHWEWCGSWRAVLRYVSDGFLSRDRRIRKYDILH